MLERLQSALKTVKESKPPSLMSHRFVTVRRGSPAARSGQIQPGDQLEAVEARPVGGLQHRDLAQILRRAGNTLRLSIKPRHHSSSVSEGADLDIDGRLIKGARGRSKDESKFYSVDLERGPTGFGFSLRGGSEYNMGLYVLGLMDGGPAQRSNKIQVSDQLVEINGDSTAGMTHSQAVEQIRRGGHRIHLVLKKGNGYVPDYVELSSLSLCMTNSKQGPEEGALSPSPSSHPAEQDVDTITMATTSLIQQRKVGGGTGRGGGGEKRRGRREGEAKRRTGGGGLWPPDLDLDLVEEEAWVEDRQMEKEEEERRTEEEEERRWEDEAKDERKRKEEEERRRRIQTVRHKKQDTQREQGRRSQSLSRNSAQAWDTSLPEKRVEESEGGARRGGEGARQRARGGRKRLTERSGRRGRTETTAPPATQGILGAQVYLREQRFLSSCQWTMMMTHVSAGLTANQQPASQRSAYQLPALPQQDGRRRFSGGEVNHHGDRGTPRAPG
ncbi:hypothetical protein INR49_018220 [Caranx melampygus]|nr:hypothetical protein INR49_018220 [Caranx melampygus]